MFVFVCVCCALCVHDHVYIGASKLFIILYLVIKQ